MVPLGVPRQQVRRRFGYLCWHAPQIIVDPVNSSGLGDVKRFIM